MKSVPILCSLKQIKTTIKTHTTQHFCTNVRLQATKSTSNELTAFNNMSMWMVNSNIKT